MYTNKSFCLSRTKEILGFSLDDISRDLALNELLEISRGLDKTGIVHYRPYYAAAKYVITYTPEQKLESAEGVKFRNPREIYENLLLMQQTIDLSLGLLLKPGTEISTTSSKGRSRSYGIVSQNTSNTWGIK